MLTKETITEGIVAADELDRRSIFLTPQPNTPLSKLVELTSLAPTQPSNDTEYLPEAETIFKEANMGLDTHSVELDSFSTTIAEHVRNHLAFTKNVVKPVIEKSVERINKRLSQLPDNTPTITINQINPPEPTLNSAFFELVKEYEGVNYNPNSEHIPTKGVDFSTLSKEILLTGNNDLDAAIQLYVNSIGESKTIEIVTALFSMGPFSIQKLMEDRLTGPGVAALVFLITNKIFDNPFEGVTLSLEVFNERVDIIRKQAAYQLLNFYSKMESDTQSGLLIINFNAKEINVNGPVYKQWIESGGSDIIIYGCATSARPKFFVKEIDENRLEYQDNWQRQVSLLTASALANVFNTKKTAVYEAILNTVQEEFSLCYQHLMPEGAVATVNLDEYKEFLIRLPKRMNELRESDLLNVWNLVTALVCDCVFYYTSAKQILEGVDEAIKVNPDLHIREALLLSTIEYVADYVCDQISDR